MFFFSISSLKVLTIQGKLNGAIMICRTAVPTIIQSEKSKISSGIIF